MGGTGINRIGEVLIQEKLLSWRQSHFLTRAPAENGELIGMIVPKRNNTKRNGLSVLRGYGLSALLVAIAPVVFGLGGALAQVRPDAGRIQQELERGRVPGLVPPPPGAPLVEEPSRPALTAPASRLFFVKGFRISRGGAFPEADLLALLKDFTGKELSLADLERAADVITRYYREHGYFVARAYVPAQDLKDGIVEITVLEGKLDRISLKLAREIRLNEKVVDKTLRAALPPDGQIRLDGLERGLLLLNDLPGVDVHSVLLPGSALGTSIIAVEANEGPLVSGNLDLDNYGSKFTGPFRLGPTLNLNNPSGYGDLLTLRATASTGTSYGRLAYQIPVGYSGLKLGGAYADTSYKLCCEFASLQAKGKAQTSTLNAQYPFLRGRAANLYGTVAVDAKHYFNETIVGTTSDKKASVIALGVNGDSSVFLGEGGLSSFGLTVSSGRLNLDGWAPDRAADAASALTHGSYGKSAYSMARLQKVGEKTFLYAGLSGQIASKNLDSSEKFVLGGPLGVRAYPTGEAAGDEGLLLSLELRYDIQPAVQLSAFIDHGQIWLHRNPWDGWQGTNTRISNRYALSGLGFAVNWNRPGNWLVRASVAMPIGENPGRDVNGNDSDNTKNRIRLWLQVVKFL
jgi:hemolysin activation/secretion protein